MNALGLLAMKAMNLMGAMQYLDREGNPVTGNGDVYILGNGLSGDNEKFYDISAFAWLGSVLQLTNTVTLVLIIALSVGGILYGAILGVNLARAEDAEKREAAKKRLIWAVVGLGSIVAIALILNLLLPYFPAWLGIQGMSKAEAINSVKPKT